MSLTQGNAQATPGTVVDDGLRVACGGARPCLLRALQRPGRGMMEAADFLRGQTVEAGTRLGVA